MSGAEIFQVVGAAFELVRFSSEVIEFFRKVHNAKQAASDTYLRIKQLHRVAADVELALRRRSNQPGVSQKRLAQNERMIWKNTRVHLKRCHQILSLLRRELVGFDGEVEPGWLKRVGLQLKLELVQKERLARLHSQLDTQFQALQLNTQALNVYASPLLVQCVSRPGFLLTVGLDSFRWTHMSELTRRRRKSTRDRRRSCRG
jgi:hypothetical protein